MSRFIYSLGIRHVGEHVAEILAEHFNSIDELIQASGSTLESIEMIGPWSPKALRIFSPKRKIALLLNASFRQE